MEVHVNINRYLSKYFQRTGTVVVQLGETATVKDLLNVIEQEEHVSILKNISTEEQLRRYFVVVIDGRFSMMADLLQEGSVVKFIPPICGG